VNWWEGGLRRWTRRGYWGHGREVLIEEAYRSDDWEARVIEQELLFSSNWHVDFQCYNVLIKLEHCHSILHIGLFRAVQRWFQ